MIVKIEDARERCINLFLSVSVPKKQCDVITDNLILCQLAGITTHGFRMIPAYIKKIKKQQFNLTPNIRKINGNISYSLIDCDNAIGLYSADFVIKTAIDNAKENGIHIVWCRNANTFGAAFPILAKCTTNKMIGICCSNSPAQMAPIGGREKLFGTNPLGIGIPADCEYPFILDMATSVVAKSKINEAKEKHEKIPIGWALDEFGNPTDDPSKAQKGFLLPIAGTKGYGICMAIDMIAGLLSGASFLDGVGRFYSESSSGMNVGQYFTVIDPTKIYGDSFFNDVDAYLKRVYSSSSIDNQTIKYPGMGKFQRISQSNSNINIDDELIIELKNIGW